MPKPSKRSHAAKRDAEFRRTYHSAERVAFVRREACRVCGDRPSENAHIGRAGKGMGRKADYTMIAPLCSACHAKLHRGQLVIDRATAHEWCVDTERRWQAHGR